MELEVVLGVRGIGILAGCTVVAHPCQVVLGHLGSCENPLATLPILYSKNLIAIFYWLSFLPKPTCSFVRS